MKKFVNFKFVVMFALALVANVASYAQDNVIDEVFGSLATKLS